ncbi:MAG: hypothetical protein PHP54_02185 [Clostridia bacterium]|nr:hypothetical protein [Clostridia bacterium]
MKNETVESVKKRGFKESMRFYKNHMLRKHLTIYIICMVLFAITFAFCLNNFNATSFLQSIGETAKISTILLEFVVFLVLSLVLGFIPRIKASLICILYASRLASYVANILFMRTYNKIFVTILAIISLLIMSFTITIGMNMSKKHSGGNHEIKKQSKRK